MRRTSSQRAIACRAAALALGFAATGAAAPVGSATGGSAAPAPIVRLIVSRTAGAASCPDAAAVRHAVARTLARDPFDPAARDAIVVAFRREPHGFSASLSLEQGGTRRGTRSLRTTGSCDVLAETTALAIAIAVDPHALAAVEEPSVGRVQEAPPASAPRQEAPVPAPAPAAVVRATPPSFYEAHLGLSESLGVGPRPSPGVLLGGGWQRGHASLALEARVDAPFGGERPVRGGWVASWIVAGGFEVCAHWRAAFGCADAQLGALQARSETVHAPSVPWFAAGVRVGAVVPLTEWLSLRLRDDMFVDSGAVFRRDGSPVWTAPRFAGTLGIDLVRRFP